MVTVQRMGMEWVNKTCGENRKERQSRGDRPEGRMGRGRGVNVRVVIEAGLMELGL